MMCCGRTHSIQTQAQQVIAWEGREVGPEDTLKSNSPANSPANNLLERFFCDTFVITSL
jgi:hypothetical protein